MVPQTFFDVFPMELKAYVLANYEQLLRTVHFL